MTYTIENTHTAFILGTFETDTEEQALEMMAKEAGYHSTQDIPNYNPDELNIYES